MTRKTLSLRFGREPIVRNSEYRKAQALTKARPHSRRHRPGGSPARQAQG